METQFQEQSSVAFEDQQTSINFFKSAVPPIFPRDADTTREAIAVEIVNRIIEGRIFPSDRKFIQTAIRDAYYRSEHRQLQQEINELLGTSASHYRVLLDDNLAGGDSGGLILLYVIEKETATITSGMSTVLSTIRTSASTVEMPVLVASTAEV